jgi:hypothetical protein
VLRSDPRRGVAQPGRALGSGPRGRRFKSSRPDQYIGKRKAGFLRGFGLSCLWNVARDGSRWAYVGVDKQDLDRNLLTLFTALSGR